MIVHGYNPSDLLLSTIISIPKDLKGSLFKSDNYRGISLVNSICKLFDYVIINLYDKQLKTSDMQHIHMSHTPPTPLTSTSPVLDKTPEPRVPLIHALTATTPHPDPTPALPSPSHPHTLTAHTHATQTTVHASQSPQQPHAQHRVLRQPHKQTKDYHRTTNTTQTHRHSSKSERNLMILQVNINGPRNKLEELKLLINSGNQAHP